MGDKLLLLSLKIPSYREVAWLSGVISRQRESAQHGVAVTRRDQVSLFLRANGGGSHVRHESIREQNHLGHGAQMGCEVKAL